MTSRPLSGDETASAVPRGSGTRKRQIAIGRSSSRPTRIATFRDICLRLKHTVENPEDEL